MTSPTNGEAPKEGAAESPAAETPSGAKDKRRTSFFGSFGMKKEKKGDSDNETDGESKPKNKLGGIFRKPSKAVKMDKETPAEENKPEPVSKEEPEAKAEAKADDKPAEKPTEEITKPAETAATTEEAKPANVASTSTTVEAAA